MSTAIEKDFEATAAKINAKLKEAAAALGEANELAAQAGLPGLIYTQWIGEDDNSMDDLDAQARQALEDDEEWDGESTPAKMKMELIDVSDIESEICGAGWSTSSSYC